MDKFEQEAYPFWQYEVANGDTLRGFHDWIEEDWKHRS